MHGVNSINMVTCYTLIQFDCVYCSYAHVNITHFYAFYPEIQQNVICAPHDMHL